MTLCTLLELIICCASQKNSASKVFKSPNPPRLISLSLLFTPHSLFRKLYTALQTNIYLNFRYFQIENFSTTIKQIHLININLTTNKRNGLPKLWICILHLQCLVRSHQFVLRLRQLRLLWKLLPLQSSHQPERLVLLR